MFIYADDCSELVRLENNIKFLNNDKEVVLYIIKRMLKNKGIYYSYLTIINLVMSGTLVSKITNDFVSKEQYEECVKDVQSRTNYKKAPKLVEYYFTLLLDNYTYFSTCIEYFNKMKVNSEIRLAALKSKIDSYNN